MAGRLYLCPVPISTRPHRESIPQYNCELMHELQIFFVEKKRTAIRFIKQLCPGKNLNDCEFVEIGKRIDDEEVTEAIAKVEKGTNAGLLSEAGCPSIADPGRFVVNIAHKKGIRVIPLVGPSSILLALMASGQDGQHFAFEGYLPRDKEELKRKIKEIAKRISTTGVAHIFIETPYRNQRLFESILLYAPDQHLLTVASDISGDDEYIDSKPIYLWRKQKLSLPELPTIFIFGKNI